MPLTLLQLVTVHDIGWSATAPQVAQLVGLNALLAHAVYDEDRMREAKWWSTRAAAVAASAWLCAVDEPACAAAVVALHAAYGPSKPWLASVKPAVVGACWGVAVGPMALAVLGGGATETVPGVADAVLIAALSNVADLADVAEDVAAGVQTPAVRLGRMRALVLSVLLIVASGCVRPAGSAWGWEGDALGLLVVGTQARRGA